MERLLTSPELRQKLATAGLERARQEFRWNVCGRKSLEFFHRA
jgi:glycosyltransferase involved in cell wall biosynthesis